MELVDIIEQSREMVMAAMTAATLYLTVVSGFLIVAYTVGNRLSKFQILFVTALFVLFASFFTLGSFGYFQGVHDFNLQWGPDVYEGQYRVYAYWLLVSQILGILGSLYFMFEAQKGEVEI